MSLSQPSTCDDLLNYQLARLLASSGAPIIRICEGRYGITRREWRLIAMLADFGPLSPSALAERAHTDRPLVSRAVAMLVEKGIVARTNVVEGNQRANLALTDKGKALHRELFPLSAGINSLVLSALSPDELAVFERALDKLTEAAATLGSAYPLTEKADRRHGGSRQRSYAQPGAGDAW